MGAENYYAALSLDVQNFAEAIAAIRRDLTELHDAQDGEWFGSREGRAVFDALTSLEAAENVLSSV